jgi:hypothetical protein
MEVFPRSQTMTSGNNVGNQMGRTSQSADANRFIPQILDLLNPGAPSKRTLTCLESS